jgi:chromosome segregation ATPase
VDYFTPGLRELARKLHRQSVRLALWHRRRQLARAETQLGLLGWQQADFDPETQRQVDAINNVEREQGRLINEAAERSARIRQLRGELESKHREHAEQQRGLAAEERKLRERRAEIERRLTEKRKVEPNFERRMPDLDRELREVQRLLVDLHRQERQTAKMRSEIVRLRERTVAIPNEKNDLRTQHLRTVTEIRALEEELQRNTAAIAESERRQKAHAEEGGAVEEQLSAQMKDEEREKTRIEKAIAQLERAKANPYQQIGQVLALAGVAPMNQPQALEAAKSIELAIGGLHQSLLESEQASQGENWSVLRLSYVVLAIIAGLVLLVISAT